MTKTEMAMVLTKASAFDLRTVGDADVEAWHECIGDRISFDAAMERVTEHYRHSTDRLMPAHLLAGEDDPVIPWLQPGYDTGREPAFGQEPGL
jgi:hypothetical protein